MSNDTTRRGFLRAGALAAGGGMLFGGTAAAIEPIKRTSSRIRLSCCAYSFRKYLQGKQAEMTLDDFIDLCAKWGIDGVELTSYYFPKTDLEYLHQLKAHALKLGLDVSGTSVGNTFTLPPGEARDKQVKNVQQWVDYSAEMGAPCMRIFAGGTPKGNTEAEAAAWTVECIEACTQKCTERGVFLALEDHGGFTGKIDSLLELVAKVKNPWFALNVDTGNFADADPFASIKKAAPYAVTAHLKAEMSVAGKRGPADFEKIIAALREGSYRGYIALEYESQEDPKTAVPRILETMQKLLG